MTPRIYIGLILTGTLLLLANIGCRAQDTDSTQQQKKVRIIPLPAVFYTPETRLGYGALVSGVFKLGTSGDTRDSNVQWLAAYTLNKQIILQAKHNLFTAGEAYALTGEISFYDFPILYYGIGNDTPKENEEDLNYKVVIFQERFLKQVANSLFIGPQYRYTYLYDLNYNPQTLINDKARLERETGRNSGLGFSMIYDTRDNILNTFQGEYLQFSSFFHGGGLGGDFKFNRYTLDFRKFILLKNSDVLAFQYFGEFNTGGTPFREMSLLGGETIMRGYYNGRFRDNQQMAVQGEYRKQIISWIGVVAFASFGDVASDFGGFDAGDFKYTVGGGLRFLVSKADRLNIRIDYGIGKKTSGFYFSFAEAF